MHSGGVAVIAENTFPGVSVQDFRMIRRKRRTGDGNRVGEFVLPQSHEIGIAFDDKDFLLPANGIAGLVEAVEQFPLLIDRRFRGVHIFCRILRIHSPAESHDASGHIDDRKHNPIAESIVKTTAVLSL